MGGFFSKEKVDPEMLKEARQARIDYQNYLRQIQSNVIANVNKKFYTPESGQLALAEIKKAFDWLQKNPQAEFNVVLANYDSTKNSIEQILALDRPKSEFKNMITALTPIAESLQSKKIIDKKELEQLNELDNQQQKWYSKNIKTATEVDLSQQKILVNDKIVAILPDANKRDALMSSLEKVKDMAPSDLASTIETTESNIEKLKAQTLDSRDGVDIIMDTAVKTFWILLFIVLITTGGSLAANMAIGRQPMYRILYFFYGCIFFPIPILTAVVKRIREGPLHLYGILPTSIEAGTTRLGRLLWYPFYWQPDQAALDAYESFQSTLKKVAS